MSYGQDSISFCVPNGIYPAAYVHILNMPRSWCTGGAAMWLCKQMPECKSQKNEEDSAMF